MGKKGLSLEEKRQKILEIYYEKVCINTSEILIQNKIIDLPIERSFQSEGDRKVWS
jgi:hypothetical protein